MATLQDIYNKIDEYLLLPDKSVLKLLAAFYIANRLPVDPPWLFITSGSSTGKTELLKLLELCPGYWQVDDMTANTLVSGMRGSHQSASLLHRIEEQGDDNFLVFSDFTTMLSKRKEELSAILGTLRVVFDGKVSKSTGGTEGDIKWEGKLGLLAAVTTAIYSKTEDYAEVGQRMIIYHQDPPDDYEVGKFKFKNSKRNKRALTKELQMMFVEYLRKFPNITAEELPEFDEQTQKDIIDIAHLAVSARSPLQRDKFSRGKPLTGREDKEGIGRVQGQLMTISFGLMLQNPDHKLNDEDRKLLYKIGMDCIDPRRKELLGVLTEFSGGGDLDAIADKINYPKETALIMIEDLVALRMVNRVKRDTGAGFTKNFYILKDHYKNIMARFEGIQIKTEELPEPDHTDDLIPF